MLHDTNVNLRFHLDRERHQGFLRVVRRLRCSTRHGHTGLHGLGPLLHAREPGQARHCDWVILINLGLSKCLILYITKLKVLRNKLNSLYFISSQIPTFETRSDGRDNFVGALILAGNYNIPEVTVFFR